MRNDSNRRPVVLTGTLQLLRTIFRTYGRFLVYARPDRPYFLLDIFSILVAVITNTAMIWLMGMPLSLLQRGEFDALNAVLWVFGAVVIVNQLVQFVGGWLTQSLTLTFIGRARNAAFARLLYVSYPVANQRPKGDLLARLSNDVDRVTGCVVDARLMAFSHVLTISLYVGMLFWIDVRLALLALCATPLFIWQQRFFSERRRVASEQFLHANGVLLANEEQGLSNLRGISSNGAEVAMAEVHRITFERARTTAMRERGLNVGFMVSFTLIIYLIGLGMVLVGADAIRAGDYAVGHLVSFLLYMGYLTVPVRGMADIFFQCAGNLPAAVRVLEVLDARPLVQDPPVPRALQVGRGEIRLDHVSFGYPGGADILHDANLVIQGGETVALVGPSGSGKTTLAALLMRFYDPQQGSINIDGEDLRAVTVESLRRQVAVVWQDPFYLHDTVRANLLLARPGIGESEVIAACQSANAWEFIQALPQGLDTLIGSGGVELSGGQRQRLAIAQAILRDAPILILDEASSALDSQAEQALVQAMNTLRRGKTTLIIAHRYSSIRSAQRVIYFNGDGSLMVDRHEHLLATHPGYREAVAWQTHAAGD